MNATQQSQHEQYVATISNNALPAVAPVIRDGELDSPETEGRAKEIRQNLQARFDKIDAMTHLTPEGKREAKELVRKPFETQIEALRAAAVNHVEKEIAQAEKLQQESQANHSQRLRESLKDVSPAFTRIVERRIETTSSGIELLNMWREETDPATRALISELGVVHLKATSGDVAAREFAQDTRDPELAQAEHKLARAKASLGRIDETLTLDAEERFKARFGLR